MSLKSAAKREMFTMTKIRVMGTREECKIIVEHLKKCMEIRSVSGWYVNRGDTIEGRVYIEI